MGYLHHRVGRRKPDPEQLQVQEISGDCMLFEYCLLALVLGAVAVSLVYTAITGISPVSSTRQSRKRMLRSIPADQGGTIYELGAGWGAVAFPLARRCPGGHRRRL
jgi:hypothetical protein